MEFMLLWADDLDDALCALRHLAPKILGFVAAFALFAATGFALLRAPQATTLAVIGLVLSATLIAGVRRRRAAMANDE
jgi:predicted Na+-dependent transporter